MIHSEVMLLEIMKLYVKTTKEESLELEKLKKAFYTLEELIGNRLGIQVDYVFDEELEKLKYINQVNWPQIIQKLYKNTVHISEYNSCDYTNNKDKYISTFYLLDAEKINRIKVFLQSNERKQADIVCSQEIVNLLGKELPLANYKLINISDFIEKDIKVYG